MTHFVLVHGAWEGAWAWDEIGLELEKHGHKVSAVALPGTIENPANIEDVTLANYVKTVVDVLGAMDHKVTLVAHSMAGVVISQVAESYPDKVERLIYSTAFLLKTGDSVLAAMQRDPDGEFLPLITFSDDQSYATVDEQVWRDKSFHDATEERILEALSHVVGARQSTEPFMAPVVLTAENFGSVPKVYIRAGIDKMLSPKLQDEMLENWPVEQVYLLPTGHFPAMAMPEKLAALIL